MSSRTIKNRWKHRNKILLAYSDKSGSVYDYPNLNSAFMVGRHPVRVFHEDLIKIPKGSVLFSLPERHPVFYNPKKNDFDSLTHSIDGQEIWAVSSFLSSGYLRTHLPAYQKKKNAPILPLWAYTGVVIIDGEFFVPALRVDVDPRSDPEQHQNDYKLGIEIKNLQKKYPNNRLIKQLSFCSKEYRCLCARNFFLSRFEAPLPTSQYCNARCIGCLSYQKNSGFSESQIRLNFKPTPDEISQLILHHIENVDASIVSFGQGCEGEPLLRGKDLAKAITIARKKTCKGTININTNGSLPKMVKILIDSGLDSIRISLNSPTSKYYKRYFNPVNYIFDDVLRSIEISLEAGIFVSINLFFLPGFTDMESEVESLFSFFNKFPVNMIQTRNLNIDPEYYLDTIGYIESAPIGIKKLLNLIKKIFPSIKIGYYNPPKERMYS